MMLSLQKLRPSIEIEPCERAVTALLLLLLSGWFSFRLGAAEQTWVGASSGLWNQAANWDPAIPSAGDVAIVPMGDNRISINAGTVATVGGLALDGNYGSAHEIRGGGRLDGGRRRIRSLLALRVARARLHPDPEEPDEETELETDRS